MPGGPLRLSVPSGILNAMDVADFDSDRLLPLAQSLYSTPGSHVLLLGAGASIAAEVESAWGVHMELIRTIAKQLGEPEPADPERWFIARYGTPARYETLLEKLAPTATERQRLLRGFFEPTDDDRESGLKQPTAAHDAIARLVAAGFVRIIITLNFDRLIETALRRAGIEPTVLATEADFVGMAPIHTQRALVVHLHGDYLTPSSMLNTVEELSGYSGTVDAFLDRLLSDHGVVVAGWSATYDPALRAAISRGVCRHFSSYWVEPYLMSDVAEQLRMNRGMTLVAASVEQALPALADAIEALAARGSARHPLTVPVAVTTAKRELAGKYVAIDLHDVLNRELRRIRELPALERAARGGDIAQAELREMRTQVEEGIRVATALMATAAYWGNSDTDDWIVREVERAARPVRGSGLVALLRLPNLPAVYWSAAAAVAGAAAGRFALVRRLLVDHQIHWPGEDPEPAASGMTLRATYAYGGNSQLTMFNALEQLLVGDLGLTVDAFLDAWETVELLRLAIGIESGPPERRAVVNELTETRRAVRELDRRRDQLLGTNDVDALEECESRIAATGQRLRVLAERAAGAHRHPHLRVRDSHRRDGGYPPVAGVRLLAELERDRTDHQVISAGFFGGDADRAGGLIFAVNQAVGAVGESRSFQLAGRDCDVPDYFWLDTGASCSIR